MEDTGTQPGQTVTPTPSAPVNTPAPAPAPPPAPEPLALAPPPPAEIEEPAAPQPDLPEDDDVDPAQTIAWTASEFIVHAKSFGWYAGLTAAAIAGAVIVFFVTKDAVSVGVVVVSAILLGIYGRHQPRQLEYRLGIHGLKIGQRSFEYTQFRSFSVVPEDAFSSIVFMPLKRFAIPITIYYAPEDEDRIVKLLADRLPLEEGGHDAVDRLMQRIRF